VTINIVSKVYKKKERENKKDIVKYIKKGEGKSIPLCIILSLSTLGEFFGDIKKKNKLWFRL
jgi:hypothetical protein